MRTDPRGARPRRGAIRSAIAGSLGPLAVGFTSCGPPAGAGAGTPQWWLLILAGMAVFVSVLGVAVILVHASRRSGTAGGGAAVPPYRWTRNAETPPGSGLRGAHGQSQGRRERQEDDIGWSGGDTLAADGNHPVALVADGMGGHAAGDVASRTAVRGFLQAYGTRGRVADRLHSALDRANAAVAEETDRDPARSGMGTTLVAAAVSDHGVHWISVGDSPLWLFRAGRLERLNEDHSMRPVIARLMEEDPDAASDYSPNQLRSVLMGERIEKTDAPAEPRPLAAGDIVLLATDGVETLNEQETAERITEVRAEGPRAVVEALLDAVEAKGHPRQDNTSLFVIEVERDSLGRDPAARSPDEGADEIPGTAGETRKGGGDAQSA